MTTAARNARKPTNVHRCIAWRHSGVASAVAASTHNSEELTGNLELDNEDVQLLYRTLEWVLDAGWVNGDDLDRLEAIQKRMLNVNVNETT